MGGSTEVEDTGGGGMAAPLVAPDGGQGMRFAGVRGSGVGAGGTAFYLCQMMTALMLYL